MDPGSGSRATARTVVSVGHLLVGAAALVLAGAFIAAGSRPDAEIAGVLLGPGIVLAVVAAAFTYVAVLGLRDARRGRGGVSSRVLSVVELVAGAAMAWGVVVAVRGYGAFEPWRSPLLLPSVVLLVLGALGLAVGRTGGGRP